MADVAPEKSFSESNGKHRPKTSNETMLRDKLRFFVSRIIIIIMVFIKKTVDNKRVALQISINLKLEFKKASIYETTFKTFCPNLW